MSPVYWFNADNIDTTNNNFIDLTGGSNLLPSPSLVLNYVLNNGASIGGHNPLGTLSLQSTDLGLHNPLYSQFSNFFNNTASDRISIPYVLPAGTTKFSVSIWGNVSALTTSVNKCLIAQQPTGGTTSEGFSIFTSNAYPNTNVWFKIENNTGTQTTSNIVFGEWFHILATYDSGTAKIYFNGVLEDTTTGVTSPLTTVNTTQTILGSLNPSGIIIPMEGNLDDCAIWSGTTLTDAQAAQIYNNGKPSDISSLSPTNWWKLGDSSYTNSSNYYVFPNEIANAPDGISHTAYKPSISADAPKVVAPGVSSGLVELDKKGDAPNSTSNAISYNILKTDQSVYTPKYVSQYTVDNNYSMAFNGTSDYFDLGTGLSLLGGAFTFSAWIKADASTTGFRLLHKGEGTTREYAFGASTSNGKLFMLIYNGNSNYIGRSDAGSSLNTGTWKHVAATYSGGGSTSNFKLYIDGVETTSTALSAGSYSAPTSDAGGYVYIGRWSTSYAKGSVDELAIFDKELTANQIKFDIYEASTTANKSADFINNPNLPDPVAWYRMGD